MATRRREIVGGTALVAVTALVTSHVVSQPEPPDPAAVMAAWMELAQPGPEHAHLMSAAGAWHQANTFWMHPGADPERSEAIAQSRPIMGGRYLLEETRSVMSMGPERQFFEGMGIYGYDNAKKKHVFAWVDNHGTLIMTGEGTANAAGDLITYYSELPDPMTGGTMRIKAVDRAISDDKHIFEMHQQQPDGSWFRSMEMVQTRL